MCCMHEGLMRGQPHLLSAPHSGGAPLGPACSGAQAETTVRRAQGTPHCYRFRVPPDQDVVIPDAIRGDVRFSTNALGDFVVMRSSGLPVYNFCVAIDDALMRITHVIRAVRRLWGAP